MHTFNKRNNGVPHFSLKHFLIGMGSVLCLAGNYYKPGYMITNSETEANGLEDDWGKIGIDLEYVRKKYSKFKLSLTSN